MSKFTIADICKLADFSESEFNHDLAIVDRTLRFEALREDEPVRSNKPFSKPLTPNDFLLQAPVENPHTASQNRLITLKSRLENLQANNDQEKAEEAKRSRFLKGLLGG